MKIQESIEHIAVLCISIPLALIAMAGYAMIIALIVGGVIGLPLFGLLTLLRFLGFVV